MTTQQCVRQHSPAGAACLRSVFYALTGRCVGAGGSRWGPGVLRAPRSVLRLLRVLAEEKPLCQVFAVGSPSRSLPVANRPPAPLPGAAVRRCRLFPRNPVCRGRTRRPHRVYGVRHLQNFFVESRCGFSRSSVLESGDLYMSNQRPRWTWERIRDDYKRENSITHREAVFAHVRFAGYDVGFLDQPAPVSSLETG